MTCDRCGGELVVGSYPFCKGKPEDHANPTYRNIPDDVPGGFTIENGWREPRTFYSQSEYRKALAADGLTLKECWSGPMDRHISRWVTMDAYTLENARILVERQGKATKEAPVVCETLKIESRVWEGE